VARNYISGIPPSFSFVDKSADRFSLVNQLLEIFQGLLSHQLKTEPNYVARKPALASFAVGENKKKIQI
jgi:hypothetical protein